MRRQLLRWKQPQLHTACSLTLPWRHCHVSSEPATTTVDIATIQQSLSSPSPGVAAAASKTMKIRGRVENSRVRGKIAFIHLRQPPFHSIQVVAAGAELAGRVKDITPESIIDVGGTLVPAERPVTSVTCSHYELHAETINVVSKSATPLPFPIKDHNTKLDTRLNHRVIDMRTPLTASVLRLVSAVCQCFRSELLARDFVEIHTPKLLGTASEGGSAVFTVDYFGKPGYLAQSPQLYKQMAVMGDALGVFEIGPLFRAENSLTHRHLTEFVGLDAEFVVRDAYTEILDVLESTVCGMIYHLQENHAEMIQQVRGFLTEVEKSNTAGSECLEEENKEGQEGKENGNIVCELSQETLDKFGFLANKEREEGARTWATTVEGLLSTDSYHGRVCAGTMNEINNNNNEGMNKKRPQPKVLRLSFENAVRLLLHHSVIDEPISDFTLPQERRLGELVRARYGVDVYIVDQFPASSRPFYTLPHPSRAELTCSFDMYLRGEEICSGAQRIHDAALLLQNIGRLQADAAHLKDYVDAFRYGAWPHGGFGLGLERIVLFLLGAKDIRQISLFPRDPKRLTP